MYFKKLKPANDIKGPGEASSPIIMYGNSAKVNFLYFFLGPSCPDPDPLTQMNPDPKHCVNLKGSHRMEDGGGGRGGGENYLIISVPHLFLKGKRWLLVPISARYIFPIINSRKPPGIKN
jgi:hypothetical protein